MRDLLRQIEAALDERRAETALVAAAWQVAEKMQALRDAVGPLKRGWIRVVPRGTRTAVRTAQRCAFLVRDLAHSALSGDLRPKDCAAGAFRCRSRSLLDRVGIGELPPVAPSDPRPLIGGDRRSHPAAALDLRCFTAMRHRNDGLVDRVLKKRPGQSLPARHQPRRAPHAWISCA